MGLQARFYENVKSIAPGQSAVFYEGDDVVAVVKPRRRRPPPKHPPRQPQEAQEEEEVSSTTARATQAQSTQYQQPFLH
jgi:hypothetical protein